MFDLNLDLSSPTTVFLRLADSQGGDGGIGVYGGNQNSGKNHLNQHSESSASLRALLNLANRLSSYSQRPHQGDQGKGRSP